jgi:hypothetical protein
MTQNTQIKPPRIPHLCPSVQSVVKILSHMGKMLDKEKSKIESQLKGLSL